jgi:hypothetical protein
MIRWLAVAVAAAIVSVAHADTVTQTTQGWCSPAVADTKGNVTINCQGVDPRALQRLNELLDKKDLELADKIKEANDWAQKYHDLLAAAADDPELQKLIKGGELEKAGTILDQQIEQQEAVTDRLAGNHFQRAQVFSLQFLPVEALPHFEKAYRYRPENTEYALAYAVALQTQNDHAASEQVYRQLLPRLRSLAAANPAAYLPDLAGPLNNLGILYSATQRLADAEQAFVEARDTYQKLAAANPAVYLPYLATTLNNLGVLYRATQRLADAEQAFVEARDIRRKLAAANPAAYLPDLAETLNNLGIFLSDSGRTGEAEQVRVELQEVRRHLDEMKGTPPGATTAQ